MSQEMTRAVLSQASAKDLQECPAPKTTLVLCIRRSEEHIFDGVGDAELDVRRSPHVEEVPLPDLAPDEALVAALASAVNYNTVWSALFRPVSTVPAARNAPTHRGPEPG